MPFERVAVLSELPPGQVVEVRVGPRWIALCNVDGVIHAMNGACPHMGGALAQGALHGSTLVCPWHAWEFDCTTGVNIGTGRKQQKTYDVQVDGDAILVDLG